jgi:hypothetical protein
VPTHFFLQVGNKNPGPFTDGEGNERLFPVLLAGNDMLDIKHTLQLQPLFAGNDFFALGLVVDKDGRWETFTVPFTTKQRKVTLDFSELHILNDGALGDTTAEFNIWVRQGDKTIKHFFFGDIDNFRISDSPDPGHETEEHIPLAAHCAQVQIGPEVITSDNHDIGILIRGLCRHTAGSNEPCANYLPPSDFPDNRSTPPGAKFFFPTGTGESPPGFRTLVNHAMPQVDGDEFEFNVTTNVTVEYP